jgi:uncharacterized membrane protein YtjA (UPF0391 family)
VDTILLLGIILLVLALLGFGGVINALASIAWILLLIAVIVIAGRLTPGRRPVCGGSWRWRGGRHVPPAAASVDRERARRVHSALHIRAPREYVVA